MAIMILPQVHLRNVYFHAALQALAPGRLSRSTFPSPLPPSRTGFPGDRLYLKRIAPPLSLQSVYLHRLIGRCLAADCPHISWKYYHPTGCYLVCCTAGFPFLSPRSPRALGCPRNLKRLRLLRLKPPLAFETARYF
jgi:hypothetical protein